MAARLQPRTRADDPYLAALGERVRKQRALRGMSRRQLARAAGVSERYLAQLETGKGNVSVLVLRQVAQALGLPVAELVREGPEPTLEHALLLEHLRGLDAAELARLYASIAGPDSRPPERYGRIALVGLRGAGKTTVGAALARRLSMPFVELVQEIEREAGMGVGEILAQQSQRDYRELERRALAGILDRFDRVIVATGGSIVAGSATYDELLRNCWTLWLRAEPADHMSRVIAQGDFRPMADNDQSMEDLQRILAEREPLYALADHTISTSGKSLQETLDELAGLAPVAELVRRHEEQQRDG